MNKRRNLGQQVAVHTPAQDAQLADASGNAEFFTFGEPTPVLDGREILDYLECWQNGRWYEPPVSLAGLAKATRSSVYLNSGLAFRRNALERTFIPHKLLSRRAFGQLALDWVTFGMCYVERRENMLGQPLELKPCLTKYMRRGVDEGVFFQVTGYQQEHEFAQGSVCQLREADINQEIYGLPDWLPALQSALLNEAATLFRRKYYQNGSHAGFILYMTDAVQDETFVGDLRTAMRNSKGPGNFRNLFLHAPGGKKDGLQMLPISEVAAKDDFGAVKNISRDDQLGMLRVYPQLMGIVPQNAGGFGSLRDAGEAWAMNELEPMQARLAELNDWLGVEVIKFREFELPDKA